ncbi:MAG: preprotein translocase subunit SecE, partial [Bacteroidota bacterium]|nr:preprotein translocase subunit SecE [Bacteroidota bacterium]
GRALVSKTRCREFESLHPCKELIKMAGIRTYVEEIINELSNKVSWPTWEELQTSSVIVLVTSIILALIIWLMDYAFGIWSVPEGEWGWKGILGFIYELIQ